LIADQQRDALLGHRARWQDYQQQKGNAGPRQIPVRLILPNGDERIASMRLDCVFQTPPPKEYRLECILPGVAKADVPIGTEVWTEA